MMKASALRTKATARHDTLVDFVGMRLLRGDYAGSVTHARTCVVSIRYGVIRHYYERTEEPGIGAEHFAHIDMHCGVLLSVCWCLALALITMPSLLLDYLQNRRKKETPQLD